MGSNHSRSLSISYFRLVFFACLCLIGTLPRIGQANEFHVTTTRDNVPGSLRSAIIGANITSEPSTISFDLSSEDRNYDHAEGVWVFLVEKSLPLITDNITITGQPYSTHPQIIIEGTLSSLSANTDGLVLKGKNIAIENITIRSFPRNGIYIQEGGDLIENIALHNIKLEGNGHGERYGGRVLVTDVTEQGGLVIDGGVSHVKVTGSQIVGNYGSGIILRGEKNNYVQNIDIEDTAPSYNHGHGIWAEHTTDVVIDGAVRSDIKTIINDNKRTNITISQSDRITMRSLRVRINETTDRGGNIILESIDVAAAEHLDIVGGSVSGIMLSNVWEGSLRENLITDVYPHAVEQFSGLVRYNDNIFRDIEESAIFAGPLYGSQIPFATLHIAENIFEGVGFAVSHEYSCIASVGDVKIPSQVLHARPFLVRIDPASEISPKEISIAGAGIPPATLVPIGDGYYGYQQSLREDVRSWPRAKGSDAPHGSAQVNTITASGDVYEGIFEIALLDACTHNKRRNNDNAMQGLPTPYTVTMEPKLDKFVGGYINVNEPYEEIIGGDTMETTGSVSVDSISYWGKYRIIYDIVIFSIIVIAALCLILILLFVVRSIRILRTAKESSTTIDGVHVTRRIHYVSEDGKYVGISKMMQNLLCDHALFFAIAQFIVSGLNYVFIIIIARFGGIESLGGINAMLVVLFLSAMPAVIMQDYTTYSVSGLCCTRAKRHIISRYILYSGVIAFLVFILALSASPYIMRISEFADWPTMFLFAFIAGINYLLPVQRGVWQAHKNFYILGAHLLVEAAIKSGSIFLYLIFFSPLQAVLLAIGTGYIISLLWLGVNLIKRHFISIRRAFIKSDTKNLFMNSGLYFLCGVVLFSVLYNIDLLFAQQLAKEDAGLYSVAARISQLLVFGGLSIATVFLPVFREKQDVHPLVVLRRPYAFVGTGVICFFGLVLSCGDHIISLLFGSNFIDAYPLLLRTSFNMACLTLSVPGMYFLLARGRHYFLRFVAGIVAVLVGNLIIFTPPLKVMIGMFGIANGLFLLVIGVFIAREISGKKK